VNKKKLRKALELSWGIDTCYVSMRKKSSNLPCSYGQCLVTALVVNDFLGGKLVKGKFKTGGIHYWNLIDKKEIDFTLDRDRLNKIERNPKPKIVEREKIREIKEYLILKKRVISFFKKKINV